MERAPREGHAGHHQAAVGGGIGVIEEPGPRSTGPDRSTTRTWGTHVCARAPKPDQLLSFVSLGASSAVGRVCTDVTVIECNAIS